MQDRPTMCQKLVKLTWMAEGTKECCGRLWWAHHSSTWVETSTGSCKQVSKHIHSIRSREITSPRQLDPKIQYCRGENGNGCQKQRKVDEWWQAYLSKGPESTTRPADLKCASYRQNGQPEGTNGCWELWWGHHPSSWFEMARGRCKHVSKAIHSIWLRQIPPSRQLEPQTRVWRPNNQNGSYIRKMGRCWHDQPDITNRYQHDLNK